MRHLLACVVFVKQFHHYLWGRRFLLRTDHASLKWLVNFCEPEGMLARWLSILSNYDFEVQHRHGVLHSNAGGLSRIPSLRCKHDDCALKIINLSKWCLKRQVSKFANLNAIFLLDYSQMLITYYSD